jgi:hypothetical protein
MTRHENPRPAGRAFSLEVVVRVVTDSDHAPDANADASDRGANGDTADRRARSADADRQAAPRLVNPPDGNETDRSADDAETPREPDPIEPEAPRAENVVFVLLGVFGTIALLATAIVPGVL